MEQYIPKSALLAEIDRLVNNYDKALDYEAALEDVRNFIDSLEVKKSAEIQHVDETCKENGNSLTQEPVSKELEEAAKAYSMFERSDDTEVGYDLDRYGGFIAGAKWQKKQMLAKAIDAELCSDGMFTPLISVNDKEKISNIKFGDKVKVVLLKK